MKAVWTGAALAATFALTTSGELYAWGSNPGVNDALATGSITSPRLPVPASKYGWGVSFTALGGNHTCAGYDDGGLRCIGSGTLGQLGDGQRQSSLLPVEVLGLPGPAELLSLSANTSCALVDGGVFCWGAFAGDAGSNMESLTAVPFGGLETGVTHLASGVHHHCAVKDEQAWCWGLNVEGELGDSNRPNPRFFPLPVPGIDAGVVATALSENHSCALAGGQVWCWGLNGQRQVYWGLALGRVPQAFKVDGAGSDVVAIAATRRSTCALKGLPGARTVLCWGSGPVGDGAATLNRTQPATVVGLGGNIQSLVAAQSHYCALVDNELRCWGNGLATGVGAGTDVLVPTPLTAP